MAVATATATTITTTLSSPLPSPPSHLHESADHTFLFSILSSLAFIIIVIAIYILFAIIPCPSYLYRRQRRPISGATPVETSSQTKIVDNMVELVSDLKYNNDEDIKEYGSECPVCLSVFVDGEVVRQLKACKHVYHGVCIDMWLHSHSSCPVCRRSILVKRSPVTVGRESDEDFRQGLPDSASLV